MGTTVSIGLGLTKASLCVEMSAAAKQQYLQQIDELESMGIQNADPRVAKMLEQLKSGRTCQEGELCRILGCAKVFQTVGRLIWIASIVSILMLLVVIVTRETNNEQRLLEIIAAKSGFFGFGLCITFWILAPSSVSAIGVSWGYGAALLAFSSTVVYGLLDTNELLPTSYDDFGGENEVIAPATVKNSGNVVAEDAAHKGASNNQSVLATQSIPVSRVKLASERCHFTAKGAQTSTSFVAWKDATKLSVRQLPPEYGEGRELIMDICGPSGTVPIRITEQTKANFDFAGKAFLTFEEAIRGFASFLHSQLPAVFDVETSQFVETGIAKKFDTIEDLETYTTDLLT